MIGFLDGPAQHVRRMRLGRTPFFLRVVRKRGTRLWDALDQLEDVPAENEEVFVYERASEPLRAFIRPGGLVIACDYRLLRGPQPPDEDVRTNDRWRHWCEQAAGARRGDPTEGKDGEPIDYGLDTGSQ